MAARQRVVRPLQFGRLVRPEAAPREFRPLEQAYDAQVRSLRLDWMTGDAFIELLVDYRGVCPVHVRIHAIDVCGVTCSRAGGCGVGSTVKAIRTSTDEVGRTKITFQAGSGSVLALEARTVALEIMP